MYSRSSARWRRYPRRRHTLQGRRLQLVQAGLRHCRQPIERYEKAADNIIYDWAKRSPHERHWDWDTNRDCNRPGAQSQEASACSNSAPSTSSPTNMSSAALVIGDVKEKWQRTYHLMLQEMVQ